MRRLPCLSLVVGLLVVVVSFPGMGASETVSAPVNPVPGGVLFFAADGMRPVLMERFVAEGSMPGFKGLTKKGVKGANGLVQAFPPTTGVGWYTIATGAYPSEHGSTNNTFFRTGDSFNNRTAAFSDGILQADTIGEAAARAGKKVVSVEWAGAANTATPMKGPVVDYRSPFTSPE